MSSTKTIALFAGSDISTHLLVNALVPTLLSTGYHVRLYLPSHRPAARAFPPELEELTFFERILPSQVLYPYLDATPACTAAQCSSPRQIAEKHGIALAEVENVNNPEFLAELADNGVQAGISIRCYQKFGPELILYFNRIAGRFLWNLHPGILPRLPGRDDSI